MKKSKEYTHILIAVALFILLKILLPTDSGLTSVGATVLSLILSVLYLWITVGIGWPSFLVVGALCLTRVAAPNEIWAASWGSYIIPLVVGISLLNNSVSTSGLAQRLASWLISRKVVNGRPYVFIALFMLANLLVAFFMDIIPCVVIFMAIAESICRDLEIQKGEKFSKAIYLSVLTISLVGYAATPIGHGLPLAVLALIEKNTGVSVSFFNYMIIGIPYAVLYFCIINLVIRFVLRPDFGKFQNYDVEKKRAEMPPLQKDAKIVGCIFLTVIFLWLFPDIFNSILPGAASYIRGLGPAVPPIIGVVALCLIHNNKAPIIILAQELPKVSWASVIFIVAINAINAVMTLPSAGITDFLQNAFAPLAKVLTPGLLAIVAMILVLVLTNFMSSFVSMTVVYSSFIPMVMALTDDTGIIVALGVMMSILSSTAFMTPPSNPSAPLVFGSGYIEVSDGLKYVSIILLAGLAVTLLIIWPLAKFVL